MKKKIIIISKEDWQKTTSWINNLAFVDVSRNKPIRVFLITVEGMALSCPTLQIAQLKGLGTKDRLVRETENTSAPVRDWADINL